LKDFAMQQDAGSASAAFPPTPEAAQARLAAIRPDDYARTRNAIDGAVTRLSPYLTHGLLDVPGAIEALRRRESLPPGHKLVFEFAWREYFRHVMRHLGEGVLEDVRPSPRVAPRSGSMPADLLEARTGVPAIDRAVSELYATGWLHNHARMWLASYAVHLRGVHWRAGADWMHAQLLDGELASNHLSWQWVAGTFSSKPYLFDAANVAHWAPPAWHSPGTAIDRARDELERIALSGPDVGPEPVVSPGARHAVEPPSVFAAPAATAQAIAGSPIGAQAIAWPTVAAPARAGPAFIDAAALPELAARLRAASPVAGPARVVLVHPWALGEPAPRDDTPRIGLLHAPHHLRFPWSARRWTFVLERMGVLTDTVFVGDAGQACRALSQAGIAVQARATLAPGYHEAFADAAVTTTPMPLAFPDPDMLCASFSRYWHRDARTSARMPARKHPRHPAR